MRNLDGQNYSQNVHSKHQVASGSLAKHASILVPLSNPSQCLIYKGSAWGLGNASGNNVANCSLFRTEGNSLYLPYVDQKTSELSKIESQHRVLYWWG